MDAKELRIGNWICFNDDEPKQVSIYTFAILHDLPDSLRIFKPISLSVDIIEKAGFKYDASYEVPKIEKGNLVLWGYDNEFGANFGHLTQLDVNVKYVHQLQNLYFALTGEELQIEL